MTILSTELPPVYFAFNALAYAIFAFSCAAVIVGLLFLFYKLVDKYRR